MHTRTSTSTLSCGTQNCTVLKVRPYQRFTSRWLQHSFGGTVLKQQWRAADIFARLRAKQAVLCLGLPCSRDFKENCWQARAHGDLARTSQPKATEFITQTEVLSLCLKDSLLLCQRTWFVCFIMNRTQHVSSPRLPEWKPEERCPALTVCCNSDTLKQHNDLWGVILFMSAWMRCLALSITFLTTFGMWAI